MENQSTKQLYKGALLLTLAGLLSKILSAGYRIPLQNITGDLGFYIYQQLYPILGIAMMLSLYGFPTAISKLVAEQKAEGKNLSYSSFYLPIFGLLYIVCAILFLSLYTGSNLIASIMGDSYLAEPLRVTSYIFLVIPLTSFFRGVFQGHNDMGPTAVSQVVEQVIRVSIILIAAVFLVEKGRNLYDIGSIAALGSIIGATITSTVLLFLWFKKKPIGKDTASFQWNFLIRVIFVYGVCISINHMLLLFLQFSDAFTLVPNLVEYGLDIREAKEWKGVFDRGQPLIQLGAVLGSSLALALIPSITKQRLEQNPEQFIVHIQSALKLSFYLATAATVGLIAIFPHVNVLLFRNDLGTMSLRILSVAILVSSLAITTATILQGIGFMYRTALFIVFGLVMKAVLNAVLVPSYGIEGSAIATVVSVSIVMLLNLYQLKKIIPDSSLFYIPWKSFGTAIITLIIFLFVMNQFVFNWFDIASRIEYLVYVLVVSISGAGMYLFVLVIKNGFNHEEMQALPFGELLIEVMQRRNKN
ncbi:polysaccharide biosynthesis protein [Aquibacillus koreensis]|uniref:Polysaccharide biosynthesis protein n=1 Tax=Aquibacillus koreensis TaxID=279446 RepID=A0A9X3WRH5_9BACI|nr:polysaccharide biosynthesis protein [Aquibacillus koreensis]MCT2534309.1 polysaccharide biosynthesis protein [Aquibacillus koreensis]MDC3422386.1 polysaccharide biosynthesis protein [Aquibacillus koreensis]